LSRKHSISTGAESVDNVLLGMITGSGILVFTNPIWVAKTRLCLQYESEKAQYRSLTHCISSISRKEGFSALYKGFTPGVIGTVHGAIQFMLYNRFKDDRLRRLGLSPDHILDTFDCLLFSGVSKMIATTVTFPYQVLRTRLQLH
uniref:Solute carrier family 25 member 43 n=1 Tax=Gongylonema pulchrum TaxID=637853 RepID=A0A183EZR5_9BILA